MQPSIKRPSRSNRRLRKLIQIIINIWLKRRPAKNK